MASMGKIIAWVPRLGDPSPVREFTKALTEDHQVKVMRDISDTSEDAGGFSEGTEMDVASPWVFNGPDTAPDAVVVSVGDAVAQSLIGRAQSLSGVPVVMVVDRPDVPLPPAAQYVFTSQEIADAYPDTDGAVIPNPLNNGDKRKKADGPEAMTYASARKEFASVVEGVAGEAK